MNKTTSKATIRPSKSKKAKRVPRLYNLPNGGNTTSQKKYLNEWEKMGHEFGNIIGGELFGFDPTLSYRFSDSVHTNTFDPIVVIRILDHIEETKTDSYDSGYNYGRSYNDEYY